MAAPDDLFPAILPEVGQAPLITAGPEPVLSWQPLSWPRPSHFDENLLALYKNTDRSFHSLLERGIGTNAFARGPVTTTDAPPNPLQLAFQGAGRLLSADAGPRIAVLAVDGDGLPPAQRPGGRLQHMAARGKPGRTDV